MCIGNRDLDLVDLGLERLNSTSFWGVYIELDFEPQNLSFLKLK